MEEILIKQNKKFLLITQNVDGLHRIAGSKNIIEIHGSLHRIVDYLFHRPRNSFFVIINKGEMLKVWES